MYETIIIVNKGLHYDNVTILPEINKAINSSTAWKKLAIIAIARENQDLDINIKTHHSFIEQGLFCFLDTIININEITNSNFKVNLQSITNNGISQPCLDDICFDNNVPEPDINVQIHRTANQDSQQLKTTFIVHRNNNKRTIVASNF